MEIKTLTSTLVLSLLLAGPEAVAMELLETDETRTPTIQKSVDQTEGEQPEGTTPHSSLVENVEKPFTLDDLTRSAIDLDLFKILVAGNQQNASPEEQLAAKQAGTQILEDAAKRNQEKKSVTPITTVTPTQVLLSTEEQSAALSLWEYWFGKKVDSKETKPTSNPVISTPVEMITGENKTTPVLTSSIETPVKGEETSYSWLENLNPLNLVPSNWWGTTNPVKTPTEELVNDFVHLESQQEPLPSQTNNLIADEKRDGD